MLKKAETLLDIELSLDPRPLAPGEIQEFFVETGKVRDPNARFRSKIARLLEYAEQRRKVLIYGHTGSGKSTEIVRFQEERSAEFRFVRVSVAKEGLLSTLTPVSLLVLVLDQAVRHCMESGLRLDEGLVERVYEWFKDTVAVTDEEVGGQVRVEAEAEANAAPFLSLFLKLTGRVKSEAQARVSRLQRVTDQKPQLISDLAERTSSVFRAIETAIPASDPRKLVLIIEDLDKLGAKTAQEIFLDEPSILGRLPVRMLVLAPIALSAMPRNHLLGQYYEPLRFPMIRVLTEESQRDEGGVAVVREIVHRRMSPNLIIDEDLDHAIEMTGGIFRSLFQALTFAAEAAMVDLEEERETSPRIRRQNVEYGLSQVRKEFEGRVSTVGLDREFLEPNNITVDALIARLRQVKNDKCAQGIPAPLDAVLLEAQALIEYNGEGYRCVNPLLRHSFPS